MLQPGFSIQRTVSILETSVVFSPHIKTILRTELVSEARPGSPGRETEIPEIADLSDISKTHLKVSCDLTGYAPMYLAVLDDIVVFTLNLEQPTRIPLTWVQLFGDSSSLVARAIQADGGWVIGVLDDGNTDPESLK